MNSFPLQLHRKSRAHFRSRNIAAAVIAEKFHVPFLIAKPGFLRTSGKVELHFARHFIHGVRVGHDLHAYFRSDWKTERPTMRRVAFTGNPGDIRNLGSICGVNGTCGDDPTVWEQVMEKPSYVCLKSSTPGIQRTQNDLIKAVGFDLVREIAQVAICTDVSPRNHS